MSLRVWTLLSVGSRMSRRGQLCSGAPHAGGCLGGAWNRRELHVLSGKGF